MKPHSSIFLPLPPQGPPPISSVKYPSQTLSLSLVTHDSCSPWLMEGVVGGAHKTQQLDPSSMPPCQRRRPRREPVRARAASKSSLLQWQGY